LAILADKSADCEVMWEAIG